jgi:hypothetical protein
LQDSEPKLEIDLELINTSNSDTNALEEDLDYKVINLTIISIIINLNNDYFEY